MLPSPDRDDADTALQLSDLLNAVALDTQLDDAATTCVAYLRRHIARVPLALARWVHLERHWSPSRSDTDLIVALEPAAAALLDIGALRPADGDPWAIDSVLLQWRDAAASRAVGRCWLEFDTPATRDAPAPGCFIDQRRSQGRDVSAALDRFASVTPDDVRAHANAVMTAIGAVPEARLASVGWLARPAGTGSLRLCVAGPLRALLCAVTSSSDADVMLTSLGALHDVPGDHAPVPHLLHLDVNATAITTFGIELVCRKAPQLRGIIAELPMLNALVAAGRCPVDERDRVQRFPGAVALGSRRDRVAVRRFSHLKVVFHAGEMVALKAYVAAGVLAARLRTR